MSPTERILIVLAERECDPKRNGKGWSARCPAHDDRRPSLSISEGDDGRALVRCHAGCTVDAICDAIGLQVGDLMPTDTSTSTEPLKSGGKRQYLRQLKGKSTGNAYSTVRDAVAALDAIMAKEHRVSGLSLDSIDRVGECLGLEITTPKRKGK